ncbi:NCS2 family permease [uncultured Clostridium sp.]|uniref:NCS2 family permease n=1 Tax=uncultured Clostridium sp. TaxID=59620 RepID=UPI0025F94C94|nr:NCS2 family permease [uncultured Clostridium sp.]
MNFISNYFNFKENDTNFKTEVIGGITTFLTIAYILFVVPDILSQVGMTKESVFVATALAGAVGTFIMGAVAKFPMVLAPGMGLNAFFAFSVCIGMDIPWQSAIAAVLVSGIIFLIVSATGLRELIIKSIPQNMKYATSAGIGFFIAFIGLKNAGIIVANPSTYVGLGNLKDTAVLVSIIGLLIMAILMVRGVQTAIFCGLIACIGFGLIFGVVNFPTAVVSMPPSVAPTFGTAIMHIKDVFTPQMMMVIFTLLFMDFFDTAGTLVAVGSKVGLLKEDGSIKNGSKALLADSITTCMGAILGTTNTTSCMESLSGIAAGAKTGFSSVVASGMFLVSLFFSPLLTMVTSQIAAPALIIVGSLLCTSLAEIEWNEPEIAISSFLTIILMPLTYSIGEGIACGFLSYVILLVCRGKAKNIHPVMYGLAGLFLIYFII